MGEAKQEAKAEPKPEGKEEKPKQEEKKEEVKPAPSPPIVLFVDSHCVGCAKKIKRIILKCRGVEAVEMDMTKNEVTVRGIVDPQGLCERIRKKTMRSVRVLSPQPPPAEADSAKPAAEPASPTQDVSVVSTVELHVKMHCEACADQLQRMILKMRGVQSAETNLGTGKATVTGTMDADKLVEYVYRRTRKLAKVVPQPPKEEGPKKEEGEQKAEEKPPEEEEKKEETTTEEAKEEEDQPAQPPQENGGEVGAKEPEKPAEGGGDQEQKKEGDQIQGTAPDLEIHLPIAPIEDADMAKRMMYWAPPVFGEPIYAAPVYVIERLPPPPQLFSDENPNACCIS